MRCYTPCEEQSPLPLCWKGGVSCPQDTYILISFSLKVHGLEVDVIEEASKETVLMELRGELKTEDWSSEALISWRGIE